jgi:hypothetical protein
VDGVAVAQDSDPNGTERANTNKKNFRGDLFLDARVFEESSSTDRGNGCLVVQIALFTQKTQMVSEPS